MMFLKYTTIVHLVILQQADYHIGAEPILGHNIKSAAPNDLPFIVSIGHTNFRFKDQEEEAHICGGTLITHRHVLTAAHCVENQDLRNLEVTVGSIDLRSGNRYEVESAVTYEEYAWAKCMFSGDSHDIAIIKLSRCVSEEIDVATITRSNSSDFYGLDAVMAGWGETDSAPVSRYLKIANTNIISYSECKETIEAAVNRNADDYLKSTFLCAKTDPYTLLGCGDSGGPLVFNSKEIIGVISAMCPGRKHFPDLSPSMRVNVFVGIEYYRSFINNIISGRWERQWLSCTIL